MKNTQKNEEETEVCSAICNLLLTKKNQAKAEKWKENVKECCKWKDLIKSICKMSVKFIGVPIKSLSLQNPKRNSPNRFNVQI